MQTQNTAPSLYTQRHREEMTAALRAVTVLIKACTDASQHRLHPFTNSCIPLITLNNRCVVIYTKQPPSGVTPGYYQMEPIQFSELASVYSHIISVSTSQALYKHKTNYLITAQRTPCESDWEKTLMRHGVAGLSHCQ